MALARTDATQLRSRLDRDESLFLLDVREDWEFNLGHIPGSVHIPMGQITGRTDDIPQDRPIVCICHHGMRSEQVAHYLLQQGWETVENLQGGVDAWSLEVDPSVPRY
ncbi:rhodanese-related sulfurtransferase [Natronocella acetinitrilica]|jgi:rhodanese-related sulfurtransferase|uniref:Rhodanese-related sulfurtransferase n=1 Tax=Natronocella acetinitrilica TaxID=414046 RepID=A0AAE3G3D4_9GAMM|nr:rhodanese-like domain-containing protein [Natronocella acetinitrilica]MCP1673167.1 rhodanese-related sulfurtransferase [Natronocella acetinitrilica]